MYIYKDERIRGKTIELTSISVILEFGIAIISSQNGKIPKFVNKYIFWYVRYSVKWISIKILLYNIIY